MPSSPSISLVLSHPRIPAVPRALPGPCLPAFAYTCSFAYNAGVCDGPPPLQEISVLTLHSLHLRLTKILKIYHFLS